MSRFSDDAVDNLGSSVGSLATPKVKKLALKKVKQDDPIPTSPKKIEEVKPKKTEVKPLVAKVEKPLENIAVKKNKPREKGQGLEPVSTLGPLMSFTALPLDYKAKDDEFDAFTSRLRQADIDRINSLKREAGVPVWVVIKSLIETFEASKDHIGK